MAIKNLEQRLKKLEDEIKALKVCYNTAGSLAKAYVTVSNKYAVGGSGSNHSVKFKFTPTYGYGQNNIITLFPLITAEYSGYTYYYTVPFMTVPQDGSGDLDLEINLVNSAMSIQIIALGTSPGTFTRVS